jgi:hypothetical protein
MRERPRLLANRLFCVLVPLFASALAAALGGVSCAAEDSDGGSSSTLPPATGGSSSMGVVAVSFDESTIEVSPREERMIRIQVKPPAAYRVTLSLLSADAAGTAPDDAALDRREVETDSMGRANVVLTAPSAPTSFTLRAQVGAAAATLAVNVSSDASVKLVLHPSYTGHRKIVAYTASAYLGAKCEDIPVDADPNPELLVRAAANAPLELVDVPAVANLAVVVSAGALARGCVTVNAPLPETETDLNVELTDLPLALGATTLDTVLGLDAKETVFNALLDTALTTVQDAMRNGADNDIAALLDEMEAAFTGSRHEAFALAREASGWDSSLVTSLGKGSDSRLISAVQRWSQQGRSALTARLVEARLTASDEPSVPKLVVSRIGGVPLADVDLSVTPESWTADSSDTLAFAVTLSWPPASLLTALAIAPAQVETGIGDVPEALAQVLSCDRVLSAMTASKGDASAAFAELCDADCVSAHCAAALDSIWTRARDASGKDTVTLSILASGAATVGDSAEAVALSGSWVGRLRAGSEPNATGGAIVGYSPRK